LDLFGSGFGPLPQPDFVSGNYAASVQQLLDVVCALPDACSSVLLVGHNPGLRALILALAGSPSKLRHRVADNSPTAAAAIIRFDADRWEAAGGGEILDLILPRELDSEV
jgi:phosphohistidine phosphatase